MSRVRPTANRVEKVGGSGGFGGRAPGARPPNPGQRKLVLSQLAERGGHTLELPGGALGQEGGILAPANAPGESRASVDGWCGSRGLDDDSQIHTSEATSGNAGFEDDLCNATFCQVQAAIFPGA
jgi:hypothetical protein